MTLPYAFVFNHIGKDISPIQKVFIKHANKYPDKLDWTTTSVAIHALPKRSPVSNREEMCSYSITNLVRVALANESQPLLFSKSAKQTISVGTVALIWSVRYQVVER